MMRRPMLTVLGSSVSLTHSPQLSLRDLNHLADRIQDLPTTITSLVLNSNGIEDEDCSRSNLIEILLAHESIVTFEALSNCLGIQTARKLANCLSFSRITQLKLGANRIGDEGCSHIGQVLRDNVFLTRLHLGCNEIGDVGLTCLADGLVGNSTLCCLGLRDNRFGAAGMQSLARFLAHPVCAISELQLKRNNLANGGAAALAWALPLNRSLRVLELEATEQTGADIRLICTALKDNTVIHALNVNNNYLKDEGAIAIGDLPTRANVLTTVGLRGNGITPIGAAAVAAALCTNKLLTGLDLGSNAIGSEGAVAIANALAQNHVLQSLDLHHNGIDSNGLMSVAGALKTNSTLKNLDVSANFSRDRGALEWGRMLQDNRSLTRLSITDNEIGNRGGQALAVGLMHNTTLRFLCFGGQSTTPPLKNDISSQLRKLINVRLRKNIASFQQTLAAAPPPAPAAGNDDPDEPPRAETPEEGIDAAPNTGPFVGTTDPPHEHHHHHQPQPQSHHHLQSHTYNYPAAYPTQHQFYATQPQFSQLPPRSLVIRDLTAQPTPWAFIKAPSVLAPYHPLETQAPVAVTVGASARERVVAPSLDVFRQIRNSNCVNPKPVLRDLGRLSFSNRAPPQPVVWKTTAVLKGHESLPLAIVQLRKNETANDNTREEELCDSRLLRYYTHRESECVTPTAQMPMVSPRWTPGPTPSSSPNPPPKQALTPKSTDETLFSKAPCPYVNLTASLFPIFAPTEATTTAVGRQLFDQDPIPMEPIREAFGKPMLSDPAVTISEREGLLDSQPFEFPQSLSLGEWQPSMLTTNNPNIHTRIPSSLSLESLGAAVTPSSPLSINPTLASIPTTPLAPSPLSVLCNNSRICTSPSTSEVPSNGSIATPPSSPPGLDLFDGSDAQCRIPETQFCSLFGN